MKKFYFTYGCEHPSGGGWTVVYADDMNQAEQLFTMFHPIKNGMLDCCMVYPAEAFERSTMYKNGNFGVFCVEKIYVSRTVYNGGKHE